MEKVIRWKDSKPINYNELVSREKLLAFKEGYRSAHQLILKRFRSDMNDDLVRILEGKILTFDRNSSVLKEEADELYNLYEGKQTILEDNFEEVA